MTTDPFGTLWLCYCIGKDSMLGALRHMMQQLSPKERLDVSRRCDRAIWCPATDEQAKSRRAFASFLVQHDLV